MKSQKRWWRGDEEVMKRWWRGDEEVMKEWIYMQLRLFKSWRSLSFIILFTNKNFKEIEIILNSIISISIWRRFTSESLTSTKYIILYNIFFTKIFLYWFWIRFWNLTVISKSKYIHRFIENPFKTYSTSK